MNDQVTWWRSSYTGETGNCVEVARPPGGGWWVRDSKDRSGPVLQFTTAEWSAFTSGVRDSEFD